MQHPDRGWIFCPEYAGDRPLELSSDRLGDASISIWTEDASGLGVSKLMIDDPLVFDGPPTEADSRSRELAADKWLFAVRGYRLPTVCSYMRTVHQSPRPFAQSKLKNGKIPSCLHYALVRIFYQAVTFSWPLPIKGNPHLLIAGLPGMGKTTCLLNLCNQMLSEGVRPIIFSYHPDFDERLQLLVPAVRFRRFSRIRFQSAGGPRPTVSDGLS